MPPLRLGLIGCGSIADAHLRAIAALPERCRLIWAADRNAEQAARVAAAARGQPLISYQEGLQAVDAVIIATPHHLHAAVALDAAAAGKHILLEKPLATTLADADRILAAVEQAGVILLVGYTRHYQPEFQRASTLLASGAYGRVLTIHATVLESVVGYVAGWLARRDQLGGGCLFSAGGHPLEWLVSMAGPVVDLCCLTERFTVEMEGEDAAVVALRFASGALGTLTQAWCQPHSAAELTLRAECTQGIIMLALTPLGAGPAGGRIARLTVEVDHRQEVVYEGPASFEFTPQLAHFLDCVAGLATPETGGAYSRHLMAAILRGYEDEARRARRTLL